MAESRLGHSGRHYFSSLLVERQSGANRAEEIPLPILPDGRIKELIQLPEDVSRLVWQPPKDGQYEQSQLAFRKVGWVERNLHMVHRAARTCARLPTYQRKESGLTLWRVISDLPGAYRIATGFRVRYPLLAYSEWIKRFDTLREKDIAKIRAHITRFPKHPHFYLLLVADENRREALGSALTSLRNQLYRNFTCIVLDHDGSLDSSLLDIKDVGLGARIVDQNSLRTWLAEFNATLGSYQMGKWVMLLHARDALPAHALYRFACEIHARPDAAIFYSDDDGLDVDGGRCHPRFKPDWSLAHLYSTHYVGAAAMLRGSDVSAAGGVRPDCCRHGNYDLLLRIITSAGEKVAHVPAVLFHRGDEARAGSAWEDPQWCASVLQMHLARNVIAAEVVQTRPTCRHIRYGLTDTPPLVSVIIPTRDAIGLLRKCIESLRESTTYPRIEILVLDNQTRDPEALAYLETIAGYPGLRVLRYDQPFNYSRINNIAAREARGEVLCLLNNDTWVISAGWLTEMVGNLLQVRVGAVGAKLYYPDTQVQHAGVAVGPGGCADHLHLGLDYSEPGYCNRAVVAHELSAVTGACMVTWKHLYERLGGLNEERLTVAFNDVDYCLRLQDAGYRVVFTPHAELFHHESATRGRDESLKDRMRSNREINYMRARWNERMRNDPYYNPNLSYQRADFSLSETPRTSKPWLN